jgi:hypothetical protein
MKGPLHVIRVQGCHFLFQHVGRDDYVLCEGPTFCDSALQTLRDDAVIVCSHENHVIAGLGIATLTHHQALIGTVISKDLCEIAVSVDLVKGAAEVAGLS